jgi:hypothetical protein
MKRNLFSILILYSLLLFSAARAEAQAFAQNGEPVTSTPTNQPRFYAYPDNNAVILRWTAGNERSVDRYVIERSPDSSHFDPIREVTGRGVIDGTGDSTYEDADSYPLTSPYFYRIRTVFKDGNSIVSPIVRVDTNPRHTPILKPTVLHLGGTLRMDNLLEDQPLTVNIFSTSGALLGSYLVNGNTFDINTTTFGKGIFIYRISNKRNALIDAGKIMILYPLSLRRPIRRDHGHQPRHTDHHRR